MLAELDFAFLGMALKEKARQTSPGFLHYVV
jgi:hypothetical protein